MGITNSHTSLDTYQYAAPNFLLVLLANLPWLVFPLLIIGRMWRAERPFTAAVADERQVGVAQVAQADAQTTGATEAGV